MIHLWKSLDGIRHAPWLIHARRPASVRAAQHIYVRELARLYETVLRVSGDRVIVDSSGEATHGLLLAQIPNIQLHVVHLIRDARAVAFSWQRARRRPEIYWASENMRTEHVARSTFRWAMQNALAELLAKTATSYCRVRYEDFAASPAASLSAILAPYEWIGEPPASLAENWVTLSPGHSVSGNPMRFKHGLIDIACDEEWRVAMPARERRSVVAAAWPLLTRYGYGTRNGT
jgi:hypothetical protein